MEYPFPPEFPQQSRNLILAESIRAARDFERAKQAARFPSAIEGLLAVTTRASITPRTPSDTTALSESWSCARLLAVNGVVSRAFATNTVSTHGDTLNTWAVGSTCSNNANVGLAFTNHCHATGALAANPKERLTYPHDASGLGLPRNSRCDRSGPQPRTDRSAGFPFKSLHQEVGCIGSPITMDGPSALVINLRLILLFQFLLHLDRCIAAFRHRPRHHPNRPTGN
jgi:hypothetical protein